MNESLFDRHVRLAELAIRRFETRRAYEWKILLGFWAAMLAVFSPAWNAPHIPCLGLIIAVALFIAFWLSGVWVANRSDKERYEYYLKKAEKFAGMKRPNNQEHETYPQPMRRIDMFKRGPGKKLRNLRLWQFLLDWNVQFQITGTIAIALLVGFQSNGPQERQSTKTQFIGSIEIDGEQTQANGWLRLQATK